MKTLGEVSKEYSHTGQVSKWDYSDLPVSANFMECPVCKTIDGFRHTKQCLRASVRTPRTVFSHHGYVTYEEWCILEAEAQQSYVWRLTLDDGRTVICVSRREQNGE